MKTMLIAAMLMLTACGYTSRDNELIGQVKKVFKQTPLICPDRKEVDMSLGVMRNGVGSMSSEDLVLYVEDQDVFKKLKDANESGALVKVKYDVKRVTWCIPEHIVTGVELIK